MRIRVDWRVSLRLIGTVLKWLWVPMLLPLGIALYGGTAVIPFLLPMLATVSGRMIASTILEEEDVLSLDQQVDVVRTEAPALVGQTIGEALVRSKTGCTVVGAERGGEVITDIGPDFRIESGDENHGHSRRGSGHSEGSRRTDSYSVVERTADSENGGSPIAEEAQRYHHRCH